MPDDDANAKYLQDMAFGKKYGLDAAPPDTELGDAVRSASLYKDGLLTLSIFGAAISAIYWYFGETAALLAAVASLAYDAMAFRIAVAKAFLQLRREVVRLRREAEAAKKPNHEGMAG